jgi:hypothetical protein
VAADGQGADRGDRGWVLCGGAEGLKRWAPARREPRGSGFASP